MTGTERAHLAIAAAVMLALGVISACAPPTPQVIVATHEVPVTVIVEVTRSVPATVIVTQLVEVVVTATPLPASPTPEPTVTPEPTATPAATATAEATATPQPVAAPAFQRWTSVQAADAFRDAGLEISGVRPITPEEYGLAPMIAVEGSRFFIPSICAECGGRIFSFASQANLNTMKAYYTGLAERSALLFTWVFTKDNILVQIRGDLDEARARQYEAALNALQ